MFTDIDDFNSRLEELVRRIMKESDSAEFDELCARLWILLGERESLEDAKKKAS